MSKWYSICMILSDLGNVFRRENRVFKFEMAQRWDSNTTHDSPVYCC